MVTRAPGSYLQAQGCTGYISVTIKSFCPPAPIWNPRKELQGPSSHQAPPLQPGQRRTRAAPSVPRATQGGGTGRTGGAGGEMRVIWADASRAGCHIPLVLPRARPSRWARQRVWTNRSAGASFQQRASRSHWCEDLSRRNYITSICPCHWIHLKNMVF